MSDDCNRVPVETNDARREHPDGRRLPTTNRQPRYGFVTVNPLTIASVLCANRIP